MPLGVLAAGILGWLFWRELKRGKTIGAQTAPGHDIDVGHATQQQHLANGSGYGQDATKTHWAPVPVFEAPANHARAELRG